MRIVRMVPPILIVAINVLQHLGACSRRGTMLMCEMLKIAMARLTFIILCIFPGPSDMPVLVRVVGGFAIIGYARKSLTSLTVADSS